jgi:DnaJ-class molecular chaperone
VNEEIHAFFYALRTGTIKKYAPQSGVECPSCDGIGRERCDACAGSGETQEKCSHCNNEVSARCSSCHGKAQSCRRCAGGGTIDTPSLPKTHPADAWTLRSVRSLSINGSFT